MDEEMKFYELEWAKPQLEVFCYYLINALITPNAQHMHISHYTYSTYIAKSLWLWQNQGEIGSNIIAYLQAPFYQWASPPFIIFESDYEWTSEWTSNHYQVRVE